MATEKQIAELRDIFIRIINTYISLEKTPKDYGTGDKLYVSELNTIEMLGDYPGINVTEFAKKQGVTKGAVSQIISKLVKKDYVVKYKEDFNSKEVKLKLSMKGETAFHSHKLMHLQFEKEFFNNLNEMTEEEYNNIFKFLSNIDNIFKKAREMF